MIRRLVTPFLQQQRRTNFTKAFSLIRRPNSSSADGQKLRILYSFLKSIIPNRTKLLKYYFGNFHSESQHKPAASFTLFSSNLNEAIEYNAPILSGSMAPNLRERCRSRSPVSEDKQFVGEIGKANNDIEALSTPEEFEELVCAYENALDGSPNSWYHFADKSCYIYFYRGGGQPNSNLAAFDLDGTLIKPKSNKRIPKSATDWELLSVWTQSRMTQTISENKARFVIFTNQNGVGMNIVPLEEVQRRIELVTEKINHPCTVLMAVEKDVFRKPNTGMFQLFNKCFNGDTTLDYEKSFYCGDAIGYPSHSDADIKFAQRTGLPFVAADKFLRGVKPKLVPE